MSTPINNGGPAYPTHHNIADPRTDGFQAEPGMTLRDYFAAHAVQGFIANDRYMDYDVMAESAYMVADQMILRREKGPTP